MITPFQRKTKSGALLVATFMAVASTQAAVISWQVATISASTDVSTAGTLIEAVNATYNADTTAPTVNGVIFSPSGALLSGDVNAAFTNLTTGNADYDALVDSLDFGGGVNTTITIGGGNLVSGETYEVQIWYSQSNANNRNMIFGDNGASANTATVDGNVVNISNDPNAIGQFATGTFVADASSQVLSLEADGMGNSQFNAYQVRQIPEPSGAVLLTLGAGFGLLRRRRR